jgi:hypothetical protein
MNFCAKRSGFHSVVVEADVEGVRGTDLVLLDDGVIHMLEQA